MEGLETQVLLLYRIVSRNRRWTIRLSRFRGAAETDVTFNWIEHSWNRDRWIEIQRETCSRVSKHASVCGTALSTGLFSTSPDHIDRKAVFRPYSRSNNSVENRAKQLTRWPKNKHHNFQHFSVKFSESWTKFNQFFIIDITHALYIFYYMFLEKFWIEKNWVCTISCHFGYLIKL